MLESTIFDILVQVKVLVLLLIGGVLAMRKSSASARHLVLALVFGVFVVVPAFSEIAPK